MSVLKHVHDRQKSHKKRVYIGKTRGFGGFFSFVFFSFVCVDRVLLALAFLKKPSFQILPGSLQVYPSKKSQGSIN